MKNNIFEGIYKGTTKGFGFVKIEGEEEEIHIAKNNVGHALNGDTVLIKILEGQKGKRKEGKIIQILKHEKTILVGIFEKSRNFGFVIPDDKKLGSDIFIPKKYFNKAKNNDKVVIEIIKFPEQNKKAEGKIIEVLGNIDEAGVDMLSIIKEYRLPNEFPEKVIKEAIKIKEEISEKELKNRKDFRKEEIFTIDGEDAKDLDDAVQVKKLKNGHYVLGVHIADVSHYVKENSNLDKEAIIRGTSVYMLNRVIPMLPKELSNGICSLNEGKDRLTLSVIMEIDSKGKVVSSEITKGIIKVTKRMNYHDVGILINSKYTDEEKIIVKKYEKYVKHFKLMAELATILKKRRESKGYLNLDIPEAKIILDKRGIAIDIQKYELNFANEIIEQFMLTANETIAERFFWIEAPFIYRVHETPDEDKIKELNQFLFNFGYKIKGNLEEIHSKAFAEIIEKIKGKDEERLISNLILRTLKVAKYESENKGHFGIASKYYCHFTSPIRRYPDLFIHRIISKYIDKNYGVSEEWKEKYREQATLMATNSSEREKIAQKAERDSVDIKKAEFMQNKIGEVYEGMVSSITAFGMFVELDNTIEGLIRFEDLGKEYFIYDENRKTLVGEKTKKSYKIGDKVKIKVIKADKQLREIDFAIVNEEKRAE